MPNSLFNPAPSCNLPCLLQDLQHPPPFILAQRTRLDDENLIPYLTAVLLIMGLVFLITLDVFMKYSMLHESLRPHHDRFVHFIADHHTLDGTLVTALLHYLSSFSTRTVLIRAISLRTWPNMAEESSCPAA